MKVILVSVIVDDVMSVSHILIRGYVAQCVKGVSLTDRPVAYAPQQPWILNDTIRSNILFGNKYDEARYNETVTACALDHDIAQLPGGHDTEIVSVESSLQWIPCLCIFTHTSTLLRSWIV